MSEIQNKPQKPTFSEDIKFILDRIDNTIEKVHGLAEKTGEILAVHSQSINMLEKTDEDYKKVVGELKTALSNESAKLVDLFNLLEKRIKSLEKWKWYLIGAISIVLTAGGYLIKSGIELLSKFVPK